MDERIASTGLSSSSMPEAPAGRPDAHSSELVRPLQGHALHAVDCRPLVPSRMVGARRRSFPPSSRSAGREEAIERVGDGLRAIAGTLSAIPARFDAQIEPVRAELARQRIVAETTRDRLDLIPAVIEACSEASRREAAGLRAALTEVRDVLLPLRSILAGQAETLALRAREQRECDERIACGLATLAAGIERLADRTIEGRNLTADLLDETRLQVRAVALRADEQRECEERTVRTIAALAAGVERLADRTTEGHGAVTGAVTGVLREMQEGARREASERAETARRRTGRRRIAAAVAGVLLVAAAWLSLGRAVAAASARRGPPAGTAATAVLPLDPVGSAPADGGAGPGAAEDGE